VRAVPPGRYQVPWYHRYQYRSVNQARERQQNPSNQPFPLSGLIWMRHHNIHYVPKNNEKHKIHTPQEIKLYHSNNTTNQESMIVIVGRKNKINSTVNDRKDRAK
jgi:hypothetical protein